MKRRKVVAETELLNDLGSDKAALEEVRTAVDNPVTDSLYLAHILYAPRTGSVRVSTTIFIATA